MTALLIATALARQMGATCATLESRMCPAKEVFQGVVIDDRVETLAPQNRLQPGDLTVWPDGFSREVLTVRVDEVWKGKPGKTITLIRATGEGRAYADWIERRTPAIWFVKAIDQWSELRLDNPPVQRVERRRGFGILPVLSIRLEVLRTLNDVHDALRAFASRASTDPEVKMYSVDSTLPSRVGIQADVYGLNLPLVPEMVPTAVALIERPLSFANSHSPNPGTTDAIRKANDAFYAREYRVIGADLLARFKSPDSIHRLRAMLSDPTVEPDPEGTPIYPVRQTAYAILKGWGVKVPPPAAFKGP